jgi:DEAD/DEAH box helicase domain-containing protein
MRPLLDRLAFGREGRLVHVHQVPAREAAPAAWPQWLAAPIVSAYADAGIREPWQHQVTAADIAHDGGHVVVATGTASGKSVAFGMVALTRIFDGTSAPDGRGSTVLYLAPTKALAHDQLRALRELGLPWLRAATYDGDTPPEERTWVRAHANYVLTNPDLLHHSLLPGHTAWSSFLRRLDVIVIDEAHSYRGVFGAHVSAIVRRLRRVCAHYGTTPVVIAASATMAEPEVTAARLIGAPVTAVVDDASPRPGMTVAFWEPPQLPGRTGVDDPARRSTLAEAADLLADCVVEGSQTLAFVRSRRGAEAVAAQAKDHLLDVDPALAASVAAYRGGYLPEERRVLESALRSGEIRALATTNALEMGIDVSGLDAVITAGWPGTRASLWQQFGRAGRSGVEALGIFVANDDPLDAFLVHHPEAVLHRPVEATVFDPGNPYVLAPHLCAAAAELPLTEDDLAQWFEPSARTVVEDVTAQGLLRRRPAGWFWTHRERATDLTDLRGTGGPAIRIVEQHTGRVLGTVDRAAAHAAVHRGAVYVHQGVAHVVRTLDLEDSVAFVEEEDVDYLTVARSISDIRIVETTESRANGNLHRGVVDVTSQVVGFQRRRPDGQVLGEEALDLPEQELRTRAVWWTLADAVVQGLGIDAADLPGSAHAAEHASIGLLPLFATCDRWDLGGVSTALHPDTGQLTVFVYDGYPGGAGFTDRGFGIAEEWLGATRDLIAECPCDSGCPSCVQSPKCGNGNNPLDKGQAVTLLTGLLSAMTGPPGQ